MPRNLVTGSEQRFPSVTDYSFDERGTALLVGTGPTHDGGSASALQWVPLKRGKTITIWSSGIASPQGSTAHSYVFDRGGGQLAFMVEEKLGGDTTNTLWYYGAGMEKAVRKVHRRSSGMDPGLAPAGAPEFSKDGRWIFFRLRSAADARKPAAHAAKVDVWGYRDLVLQPEQMRRQQEGPTSYAAVVSTVDSQVVRLEQEGERLRTLPEEVTGEFVVLGDHDDVPHWWRFSPQSSFHLVSLQDGFRKLLRREVGRYTLSHFSFSPRQEYLVYWDADHASYFSYDIASGRTRNITKGLPSPVSKDPRYRVDDAALQPIAPVAGWHERGSSLLIYDAYDIWEVDPWASRPPVNVTDGHGRAEQIQLRLAYGPGGIGDRTSILFREHESLLLTAFSPLTKHNGFYRKAMGRKGDPERLTLGPYTWYRVESQKPHFANFDDGMRPLKAGQTKRWIVKRQSATEAPNYFWTSDFRSYEPLSDLQPQREYNWLTAELVTWKQPDGATAQGVLYKPENFDPKKRYPVILNYYRQLSHRLHEFPYPHVTAHNINVPWFVSAGYLVFTPDIHYAITERLTGESACNAVVSAAQYLATLPFVDSKRMGIQGHSFGGHETNYIVTRTGLFAAAAEFAGVTDPLSNFLTLAPFLSDIEHEDKLSRTETMAGATPWERPDLYQAGSPVLHADRITTPLLMTHNMRDNQIQWRQGVELYMALRRLGKRVWMLQYDEGTHALFGRDALDYTLRLTQFFDHYLKNAPPPRWMTEGIPARLKGIVTGLELDASGKVP
jgi:dienelactone hydrolase